MPILTSRTMRYARAWLSGHADVVEVELELDRDGVSVPATLVRPAHVSRDLPAWVAMHGITRPGRAHGQLVRFTHAIASAGMATIVPEVPEWRELDLAPDLSVPTIGAAIRGLRSTGVVRDAPVGLVGFSFGAPHTIAAAGHPSLAGEVAGVCGFGGYCSIDTTFRFMMTGRHEWKGRSHHLRPDPYGRWIAAANYLTAVPDHADAEDVAKALRRLAGVAGEMGAASWDPTYDPVIAALRRDIREERRPLFDLFAPASAAEGAAARRGGPAEPAADHVAEGLAAAARRLDPAIEPRAALAEVGGVTHVLHGRRDHLIPFTESLRLDAALTRADTRLTVTRLFGHSGRDPFPFARAIGEIPKFGRALSGILATV